MLSVVMHVIFRTSRSAGAVPRVVEHQRLWAPGPRRNV